MAKVYITGIGIISAIGKNSGECYSSLLESKSGIRNDNINLPYLHENFPLAFIDASNAQLSELAGIRYRRSYSRTALLGIIAAKEAYKHAGLEKGTRGLGVISGTSVGGMDRTEIHYNDMGGNRNESIYLTGHDCGDHTEKIAHSLNINGYITTLSTACSSAANAIMLAAKLIKQKKLNVVIAGGADSLTSFTVNGFNSLKVLSKENCKPFDDNRQGITLGEGAGYVVVESEESVIKRGAKILCEISGYGNACDAFHQTAMSANGDGPYLSMKHALACSKINPSDVDYINAHGTGTQNNDLSELKAIIDLFGEYEIPFSSTKQFTGHCLGASGGIEAVISILSIMNNKIWPNLNSSVPMKEFNRVPVQKVISEKTVKHVLSNSFGFGGNNTSLVFSKKDED